MRDSITFPFELVDRYQYPQKIPKVSWEDFDFNFDSFHEMLCRFGNAHTLETAKLLFELGKEGPKEGFIVEIGTCWGNGACYLAAGSKMANREKVITIDNDLGDDQTLYTSLFWDGPPVRNMRLSLNLIMSGVYDWVIPMGASSKIASEILDIPIRALFVDGSHDYEHCASDILMWKDKIVPGGVIVFHDYDSEPETDQVKEAVKDCVEDSEEFTDIEVISKMTALALKR